MKKRLVVGVSGASGVQLAVRLLAAMRGREGWETHLVGTEGARRVLECETDLRWEDLAALADFSHAAGDIGASIASGSFKTEGMAVIPCSMKTLAGIAHGYADNLLLRAADVTLKERRKLLLLARETPLHLGHLKNMVEAAALGAVILPPVLTYYNLPQSIEDMENHLVGKLMAEFGLEFECYKRWNGPPDPAARTERFGHADATGPTLTLDSAVPKDEPPA